MTPSELVKILSTAEKLKCRTRHCYTSSGRQESVAEHSWRTALMAMLLASEFPQADIDKVIRMCLIHDLGEAFEGDIPAFEKQDTDRAHEDDLFSQWLRSFPQPEQQEWRTLLAEMNAQRTIEAKLYKALDRLEAVLQHDESDISTWIPLEYELQFTYGRENVAFSPYLQQLKEEIDELTRHKILKSK